jgi:nicotinamide phosphoribosyltransferase
VVPRVLDLLGERFGHTTNARGYKVLPPFLRVIQGDQIDMQTLPDLLAAIKRAQWSVENLVFGSGGGLLQKVNRDTQKCALKCSYCEVGGQQVGPVCARGCICARSLRPPCHGRRAARGSAALLQIDVFKDPVTSPDKRSKRGRLRLVRRRGNDGGHEIVTVNAASGSDGSAETSGPDVRGGAAAVEEDMLVTVFENGALLRRYTLAEIRLRAEIPPLQRPCS